MHVNVRIVVVGRVWDCILCIDISEEGGDGEKTVSESLSLMLYTLRTVNQTDLCRECQVGL